MDLEDQDLVNVIPIISEMLAELDQNLEILIEVLFSELYRYARIFLFIWDYCVLTNNELKG